MDRDIFDDLPRRTRADDYYSEMQQEATSLARNGGALVGAIREVIEEQSGAAARVDLVEKVPALLEEFGFNDENVVKATHYTDEGNSKNYLYSAMDYVLTEMKLGEHGPDNQICADESGHVKVWTLGSPTKIDIATVQELAIIKELGHMERNPSKNPKLKSKKELLRKAAIQQLVDDFKLRNPDQKGILRRIGRDTIVQYAINHSVSISDACEHFLET